MALMWVNLGLALISFFLAAGLTRQAERKNPSQNYLVIFNDSSGEDEIEQESKENEEEKPGPPWHRIKNGPKGFDLEFGFLSFSRESLDVRFHLDKTVVAQSVEEFGYTKTELQAVDADAGQKREAYFASKGLKLLKGNVVCSDIPKLVQKNVRRLFPLAVEFDRLREEKNYGSEDMVGAATAMVQTALEYRVPPTLLGARHTTGVLPPLKALTNGWGDCDTKSALLAGILLNWDAMHAVGVGLPGHYLMGYQGIPNRGDAFIEYHGLTYVLIEPSGPAWSPPGQVSDQTLAKLNLSHGVSIEPFNVPD
ncbi:MAG: hypothetical protein HY747_06925 [Elusimicrobia bacterium]|nr:hypothetical protein [Elusimicrobiota bacterium]